MDKKKGEKQLILDLDSSASEAIIVPSSGKFNHLMSLSSKLDILLVHGTPMPIHTVLPKTGGQNTKKLLSYSCS